MAAIHMKYPKFLKSQINSLIVRMVTFQPSEPDSNLIMVNLSKWFLYNKKNGEHVVLLECLKNIPQVDLSFVIEIG